MAVVIVQFAPEEHLGAVHAALEAAALDTRVFRAWDGELPDGLVGVDALVVTGGPATAGGVELLRRALAAEVPVLGVGPGAQSLAVAAGGAAGRHQAAGSGSGSLRVTPASDSDPLFAGATPQPSRVRYPLGGAGEPPAGAVALVRDEHSRAQAFRIGGSAWGTADLEPWRQQVPARFAALVAARAEHTATRAFFTQRAAAWEDRFAHQTPAYEAAVARMRLGRGQTALDLGCGTGRALPALRAQVGGEGTVLGVDVTHAMLTAAARIGRLACGQLLLADCARLPLPPGSVHGIFAAGLVDHLPRPRTALREWARVSVADGTLLLFHPSGRAERAARHGRPLSPDDPLAEPNLRPALDATGWRLTVYDDAARHFLARAVRAR